MQTSSFFSKTLIAGALLTVLSGCASTGGYTNTNYSQPTPTAQCYGQVIQKNSVNTTPSGGGAVMGAIAGGLIGNAIGNGSGLGTVAGAAAGGYLGNHIEKNQTPSTQLTVRLQNGQQTRVMQPVNQSVNVGDWIRFSCQ